MHNQQLLQAAATFEALAEAAIAELQSETVISSISQLRQQQIEGSVPLLQAALLLIDGCLEALAELEQRIETLESN